MNKEYNGNRVGGAATQFMTLLEARPLLTVALIIFALDVAIYWQSVYFDFQWDDRATVQENPSIRHFSSMWPPSGTRFVGNFTFALNYMISALDPYSYHLFNVIIHGINGILVWQLVSLVMAAPVFAGAGRRQGLVIALVAAAFFVAHPVNTQAVVYVSQRYASLAALFYVLAVALYLKARLISENENGENCFSRAAFYYVAAIISAVLAVKTKEISFTLPLIAILCELMLFAPSVYGLRRYLFVIPFALVALIIPVTMLGSAADASSGLLGDIASATAETHTISRADYFITQFRVVVTYLRLFFVPVGLNLDYDYQVYGTFFSLPIILSFALLCAIIASSVYILVRSVKGRVVEGVCVSFGIFWFFITLSVESSIIPIRDVIFEHRMYLPMFGAVFAASAGLAYAARRIYEADAYGIILKSSVVIVAVLGVLAFLRCGVWKSPVTLWEDVVRKSPGKARVYSNLGDSYNTVERYEDAVVVLKKAVELKHDYVEAHRNLGVAYAALGMYDIAIAEYKDAIRLDPLYYTAYVDMAKAYQKLNRYDEAIIIYNAALKIKPDNHVALDSLGTLYFQLGIFERAIKEFRAATRLKPDYVNARINLAHAYLVLGDIDSALEQYEILKSLRYRDPDMHYNLAIAYSMKGRTKDAIRELEGVVSENPGDEEARRRLDELRSGQ